MRIAPLVLSLTLALVACGSRVQPLAQDPLNPGAPVASTNPTGAPAPVGPLGAPQPGQTAGPGRTPGSVPGLPTAASCSGGGATDVGVTATTIKLGLVASITGPLPGAFNSAVEATDTYFKMVNNAGGICGRKVELLIRDDTGNGGTDLQVASKLAEEDKVFAFVGGVSAPDDSGIAKVSKSHNIPDIGFPLTWERSENHNSYGIPGQLMRRSTGEGANGLPYLDHINGIKQVAMFWLRESEVSVLSAWGFEAAIMKADPSISICHEQPSGVLDSNFSSYVLRMQGDCDASNGPIGVYSTMENNSNIKLAKSMQDQGFKPKVFAPTFSSYLPSFIDQAGGATEGAYVTMPQIPFERLDRPRSEWTPGTYELKRYIDELNRYYPRHKPPGSFGAPGWGMGALFTQVAGVCGKGLTRACLFHTLETMGPFSDNGFLSPTRPGNHEIYSADLTVQVRNGRFVEIDHPKKAGPPGAPDFWDDSVLFNWQVWFCTHQGKFPDAGGKKALVTEC